MSSAQREQEPSRSEPSRKDCVKGHWNDRNRHNPSCSGMKGWGVRGRDEPQEDAPLSWGPSWSWGHALKLAFWGEKRGKDLKMQRSCVREKTYHVKKKKKAEGICPNLEKQATLPWQLWISKRQPGISLNSVLNSSAMKKKREKSVGGLREKKEVWSRCGPKGHATQGPAVLQGKFTKWSLRFWEGSFLWDLGRLGVVFA